MDAVRLGQAQVIKETDRAILVQIEDEDSERWIPKSVIHDDSECYSEKSATGELVVKAWWAEKNGLA